MHKKCILCTVIYRTQKIISSIIANSRSLISLFDLRKKSKLTNSYQVAKSLTMLTVTEFRV